MTPELVLETGKKLRKAWLATLTPEEIRQLIPRVSREALLAGLTPEERLAGLTREELDALFKQLEAYLRKQPTTAERPFQHGGPAAIEPPASEDE